jgi:mono/diheme cytochrome c family protein
MRLTIPLLLGVMAATAGPVAAQQAEITPLRHDLGQRTFDAACSSCHYRGAGKTPFGTRGPNSDGSPDELAQYILFGKAPEIGEGGMPAFAPVLTDTDVARLTVWLRASSKPDAPWPDVTASVTKMRTLGRREED